VSLAAVSAWVSSIGARGLKILLILSFIFSNRQCSYLRTICSLRSTVGRLPMLLRIVWN